MDTVLMYGFAEILGASIPSAVFILAAAFLKFVIDGRKVNRSYEIAKNFRNVAFFALGVFVAWNIANHTQYDGSSYIGYGLIGNIIEGQLFLTMKKFFCNKTKNSNGD
ncbi:hypothetical protein [Burkholderia multivorans]|uniref:hypothetical protein n=1 Tax=Burkholderia multivorans TaxID=87883 RepID=UPI0021BEDBA6|nr:hypothetical protein [Burkholderia multivorans]